VLAHVAKNSAEFELKGFPECVEKLLPHYLMLKIDSGLIAIALLTFLLEETYCFPMKSQDIFIYKCKWMTHMRTVLEIRFILCEQMDMFPNALVGVQECVKCLVEGAGDL
jgi:hypothetical protein